jgi:hypothetical protein
LQRHFDDSAALVATADRVDRGSRADRPAQLPVYAHILQRSQARAVLSCPVPCCVGLCSRINRSSRSGRAYRIAQALRAAVYPIIHNHLPPHAVDAAGAQAVLQKLQRYLLYGIRRLEVDRPPRLRFNIGARARARPPVAVGVAVDSPVRYTAMRC